MIPVFTEYNKMYNDDGFTNNNTSVAAVIIHLDLIQIVLHVN